MKDIVYGSRGYCSHENLHNKCEDCKNDLICGFDGCKDKSTYGVKKKFPTRCKIKEHRDEEMVIRPRVYCQHNKQRNICKGCNGSSICEHGRQPNICKDCDGSGICEHGRRRTTCKDCGGGSFCEHGRQRVACKDCGGSSICEHGRQRSICKNCDGKSICEHKKRRYQCHTCTPESNHFCINRNNNSTRCITKKNPKYDNYCAVCFVDLFPNDPRSKTAHLPTKELEVRQQINADFPNIFIYGKQLFIADREEKCTSLNRFIDAQTEFKNCVLIIEIDENQHKYYDMKDEKLRIIQICQDAGKDLIVIRFNPDKYIEYGETRNPKMSKRYEVLKDKINEIIDKIKHGYKFDNWHTEIKLFFDDESKSKDDTDIRCSGFSKKAKRRCLRKVAKEGMFCHDHKS